VNKRIKLYSRTNIHLCGLTPTNSEKIYTRILHENLHERRNKQHCRSSGYHRPTPHPVPSEYTLCVSYYLTQIPGMGVYSVTNTIHHWAITGLKSRALRGEGL